MILICYQLLKASHASDFRLDLVWCKAYKSIYSPASLYSVAAKGADTFKSARLLRQSNAASKESTVAWKPIFRALRMLRDRGQPPIMAESATPKFCTGSVNGSNLRPCLLVSSFQAWWTSGFPAHSTSENVERVTPWGPYLTPDVSFNAD